MRLIHSPGMLTGLFHSVYINTVEAIPSAKYNKGVCSFVKKEGSFMEKIWKNKTKFTVFLGAVFLVVFLGILILLNQGIHRPPLRPTGGSEFAKAVVEKVVSDNTSEGDHVEMQGNQVVRIRITSGKYKGESCEAQSPYANHSGAKCFPGLRVIILVNENSEGTLTASVYNYDRGNILWILIALFLGVLCLVGGKKGVTSAAGLIFTFVCILFLYLPLMYIGVSPFGAATLTAVLVTVVVMFLIGGWSYKTLCSILGTIAGVLISGVIAAVFGHFSHISGLNVSDVETLAYIAQNSRLDVSGVLFSGILIASLGAVMDVSMSVASTIAEIRANSPDLGKGELFRSGINVGRDMMGTMSNTLILAFAGSSINTLIMIYSYSMPYLEYMNGYEIGIELLRGISGSLGVILTVPFVSFISAMLMTGGRRVPVKK